MKWHLNLQLTGENAKGSFQIWLYYRGHRTVQKLNMPVDILKNATDDVVEESPRRMLRSNVAKKRRRI